MQPADAEPKTAEAKSEDAKSEEAKSQAAEAANAAKKEGPAAPAAPEAAALRNENIFAAKLDTETQKADNQRLGGNYSIILQPLVESSYYASEFGQASSPVVSLPRTLSIPKWHGELFETLRNSVFNARTFFQVGPVQPSRMNNYGARFSGGLPGWGFLSGSFGQVKNRGMVNGNILVPLPSERTPLTTDPQLRAVVARYLRGYPDQLPNRPDIDARALNTNAPQTTDSLNGSLRLDGPISPKEQVSLSHSINRQTIHSFQFLAGQNPDTVIHEQESRFTFRRTRNPNSEFSLAAQYLRRRSDLHPEPNAVGPTVDPRSASFLGPTVQYPLDRIENTFRYGGLGSQRMAGGRHRLSYGGDLQRYQLNGFEQNAQRGIFMFTNNFGRTAMENLLFGTPSSYQVRVGNTNRGFRNWATDFFLADQWRLLPKLQLYLGLRYNAITAPTEVNHRDTVPFHSDRNNFSPRFSFAYQAPGNWILRGGYTISYGQIFPVTYSQIRYNAPNVVTINVQNPNLLNPLAGVDLNAIGTRNTQLRFSPDLTSPYSHQYSLRVEREFGPVTLEVGYMGSRTIKLVSFYLQNRGGNVAGIPLTTATIDQRRADQRYYDVITIVNGGVAYLDAGVVSLRVREFRGFAGGLTYTQSKAMDQGSMYNSVAANLELFSPSQDQYDALKGSKALSAFDSPHALATYATYRTPNLRNLSRWADRVVGRWQIASTVMARSGTPFSLGTGSDAPGFGNVDGSGGDRPNLVNPAILGATVGNPNTSRDILNGSNFQFIAPGQSAGNLGRSTFRRQAILNVNGSVGREWKWDAGYTLRFQAEGFNLFNHAQFDQPQTTLAAPSFGKITNTLNDGRVLQLSLRLGF